MAVAEITFDIRNLKEREQFFLELYEAAFPRVAKFVAHRGGSFQDAKDIFQDSLVILYEKITGEKDNIRVAHEFYLVGIAKHLWIRKFKDDYIKISLDEEEKAVTLAEDFDEGSENRLIALLELTGKKCLDLLRSFYYDNLPLQQIKEAFGFSNLHSASVQKHKCIEKMRTAIHQKSMGYEDFK